MIKEQTIKRCEQLIKPEHANWIGISNQEVIRELLNMLKEKDEMIEFQKDTNRIEKEAQKYFEEIIKQARIIDLMAEQLEGVPINKNIPNFEKPNLKECITIFTNKEDLKQYYENKSEKE